MTASALDWLPSDLTPVALRLARADDLEYQLGWECLNWSLHALEMKQVRRADGLLDVVVAAVRPIPPVVSMLFSEIINHLRAVIDNVMFHVVEAERGGPLPPDAAIQVAMPIYQTAEDLATKWSARRRRKIPEFDSGTELYRRIEALQPYNSLAVVTAVSAEFRPFVGELNLHGVHPLTLLQAYSNADKHRAIRFTAGRTIPNMGSQRTGQYSIEMEPVDAGFVIAAGLDDRPGEIDATTAVHIERPIGGVWVAPSAELAQIHTYVSDTVIPTLVAGGPVGLSLPREVRLDDTGQPMDRRIADGGSEPAHDRVAREAWIKARELENDLPQKLAPPE
jgi:hypothetical protein